MEILVLRYLTHSLDGHKLFQLKKKVRLMKIFNYYSNVMEYHQILSYMAQKNELKAIYVGS